MRAFLFFIDATGDGADVPEERRAAPTPRTREIPRPPQEQGSVINRRLLDSSFLLPPSGFTLARILLRSLVRSFSASLSLVGSGRCVRMVVRVSQGKQSVALGSHFQRPLTATRENRERVHVAVH